MAITGTITAQGTLVGLLSGIKQVNLAWTITTGVEAITVTSVTGDATITVPTGATVVAIIPPTANGNALTLKGLGGDTGVPISKTAPTILGWAGGASFILNAAAATTITFDFA